MSFLDKLNFQTKIILVTFFMIVLVVISGAIAIEKMVIPVMEGDLQQEGWRIAKGILAQTGESLNSGGEARLAEKLSTLFQIRAKLCYVEIAFSNGRPSLWIGDDKYRSGGTTHLIGTYEEGGLFEKGFTSGDPIYEFIVYGKDAPPAKEVSSIRVGVSAASIHRQKSHLFWVLFTVTILMLAVSFFLTRWFTGMIIRPVSRLRDMMHELASGKLEFDPETPGQETAIAPTELPSDLGELWKTSRRDELSRLVVAFRYMAARIRHFQEKLKERYEFEERLLYACPDGIIANDRDGRFILFNTGAERLLGYSAGEALMAMNVQQIYPANEPQRIKKALIDDNHGGPGILLELTTQVIRKDGRHIPIRLSAAILYQGGAEIAVVGFFHDLTELHQHMNALVETNDRLNEANSQLARLNHHYMEMLSFVTHELKAPLANSYMSANALRQEVFGALVPEQASMVEAVCSNLELSMEMIRHYLDLSRIEKGEVPVHPERSSIFSEVVEPVLKALAGTIMERGADISVDVPSDLEWVLDPELFRGVFTNLVSNALRHGEKSGKIRIAAADMGDHCLMEVWNSGPGIRRQDLDKLFKKFQRLQPLQPSARGTGLGLFITKTIVGRHGGKIRVESEEGKWANFIIELPKSPSGADG